MKTPSTPATREESAGAECEVCRVVSSSSIDVFRDDEYPPEVYRLERVYKLGCCPLCGAFYLEVSESDPHHYMSVEESFKRISDEVAFGELVSMSPGDVGAWRKNAKQWLDEKFDTDARVRALASKLTVEKTAETLAKIYFLRQQWGELEAFLRDPKALIRGAALDVLISSGELILMPRGIVDAVATLLKDRASGRLAYIIFGSREARGRRDVSPLIATLVEYLGHNSAKVRTRVVSVIRYYLEPKIEYDGTFVADPEGEKTPKLGEVAEALYPHIPLLVRHVNDPLSASWVDPKPVYRPDLGDDTPKDQDTGIAAKKILKALCIESEASKDRVRQALGPTAPAQLRKMFPDD